MKNEIKEQRAAFLPLHGQDPKTAFASIPTPAYVIDQRQLQKNGEILANLAQKTGVRILLAQKAFSNFSFYPLLSHYLAGTEASGLYEARLGFEEMPHREVHVFSTAYRDEDYEELLHYADHIIFNSIAQLKKFGPRSKGKSLGLRINPECSTQHTTPIYDPCASGSRLGVTRAVWDKEMDVSAFGLLDGLHFHTLCEQNADALEETLHAVDASFGDVLKKLQWINMGGGHHITKEGYRMQQLERCIQYAQDKWRVRVYLEPGEAVALNAGFFLSRVLDLVQNKGLTIAILDCSAACHMPDVLEMPYKPQVYGASAQDAVHTYRYRLAGVSCLAGDIIGDYYFSHPLHIGDLITFGDMAIYTTCKNNTFNGIPLPGIWKRDQYGECHLIASFSYHDFKHKLG